MIYRIHYNWIYCTQFGEVYQVFQVGDEYTDLPTGIIHTCISIEYKAYGFIGYAIVHFDDGSTQIQGNLNAVLIKPEDGIQTESK